MKNLALAFCSIRPSQYPDNVCDNREKEYLRSLKQLQRVLPKSFDLLVCENTIDDARQIKNDDLRDYLNDTEMCATGSESNMGTANKGMGELALLKSGLDQIDLMNMKILHTLQEDNSILVHTYLRELKD